MHHFDHGLGAIGLLCFAAILAVLVFTGIPLILAGEPLKASDWLGFAGSIAGAMMALIAAAVAWRAVQWQIEANHKVTDRTAAFSEIAVINVKSQIFEDRLRQITRARLEAASAAETHQAFIGLTQDIRRANVREARRKMKRHRKTLQSIQREMHQTETRRWGYPLHDDVSYEFDRCVQDCLRELFSIEALLKQIEEGLADDETPVSAYHRQRCHDVRVSERLEALKDCFKRHSEPLGAKITELNIAEQAATKRAFG